uniref:Si:ch211-102l7.3 n=1 Tax=Salarias fasciatus TaxID=181472 RepID=A0A672G0M0_SALFA
QEIFWTPQFCPLVLLPSSVTGDKCPSSKWNVMCRPCCEYQLIQCRCPSEGSRVGYTVPCCRNALDECDPCIYHPGCSLFENCKTCHNGTWKANDDFFVNGKFCTECRQGWSGGDCRTCGGVIQRAQGHIALEGYPTNARCEWTVRAGRESTIELRFSLLSLEADHSCRHDYVEVRDGDDSSSPVIGRFCGDRPPPPIRSSGSVLHILFSSDGYNNFDGFVVTFQESSGRDALASVSLKRNFTIFCTVSTLKTTACALPERPTNGYLEPVYGPEKELVFVNYQCLPPFILTGVQQRSCLPNGTWSGTIPSCVKACREPKVSELVRQSVVKPHLLGSILTKHSSLFSRYTALPRGFHPVHTSIEYRCALPLYRHTGNSRRTCLKTGRWSGRHVSCSPGETINAQWPWHVTIYIRSAPDHTGASEESSFWHLVCSGALVAQRRVLVAARCVVGPDGQRPLHPAHVKVVPGTQYQTSRNYHLRVSDVIIHPRFYSAADSDVAVLKLKDKAKISQRVLPVCLPKVQGGEVTAQEAFTARWTSPGDHRHLSHYAALSETRAVQLTDVAQCEREFARSGARTREIGDTALCVLSEPASPPGLCPAVLPGITVLPPRILSSGRRSPGHEETREDSGAGWQLLALESSVDTNNCQQSHSVQTKIGNFLDWIEENMK